MIRDPREFWNCTNCGYANPDLADQCGNCEGAPLLHVREVFPDVEERAREGAKAVTHLIAELDGTKAELDGTKAKLAERGQSTSRWSQENLELLVSDLELKLCRSQRALVVAKRAHERAKELVGMIEAHPDDDIDRDWLIEVLSAPIFSLAAVEALESPT